MNAAAPPARTATVDAEFAEVRRLLLDWEELVRAVGSGRRRNATVPHRRVELRYVEVGGERCLQVTEYDETQAHVRNERVGPDATAAINDLIERPFGNWYVETRRETVQLRVTKRGQALLHRAARAAVEEPSHRHDRTKRRRLAESDPLFRVLGMAAADGRIKPTRRAKYRQVEDFLGAVDAVVTDGLLKRLGVQSAGSARGRPLRIVDLGCGNAYLTFAAFRYLTAVRGISVEAVGIDVRAAARRHNERVADQLGIEGSVTFVDSAIADAAVAETPDLVLALHACDTATDDALAQAVLWRAPVILVSPCCHHDVQRQLRHATAPEPYEVITRQPILRERLADVLTDALRAAILRLVGYRAEIVEFVDPEHTPRNVLIRAVRTEAAPRSSHVAAYQRLVSDWHIRPALAERLAAEHPLLAPGGERAAESRRESLSRH